MGNQDAAVRRMTNPLYYCLRRGQAAAASSAPVATIVTTKVGTFTVKLRGEIGDEVIADWGDGSEKETVVLNGTGYGEEVSASHSYTSGVHVVRLYNPLNITYIELTSMSIVSVDLSETKNNTYIRIYNSSLSGFSNISSFRNLNELTTVFVALNSIVDISPLIGLNKLTGLYAYSNDIVDISPIVELQNLITVWLYINRNMLYPEPDQESGISLNWAIKHKGTYDFHDTMKTVLHPDWMLNDLAASGWDNAQGANTVNLSTTHAVTALSDASRALLTSNGVSLTVDIGDLMIVNGDSMSTVEDWPAPAYMSNPTWNAGFYYNLAIPGQRVQQIDAAYTGKDSIYLAPAGYSGYYFLLAGTNDISNGRSSAEIIANLTSIYQKAASDYSNVCAIHILPRSSFDAGQETIRNAVNSFISSSPDVDTVVTVPAALLDPEDTDYYSDGTHLTALGNQVLATAVETAMGW